MRLRDNLHAKTSRALLVILEKLYRFENYIALMTLQKQ
jgi:hypothetical protein